MNGTKIDIYNHPNWIISGNKENFELSIQYKQIWGVMNKWYPYWKALEKEDVLFFYISGIKKIIGIGRTGNKFIQRDPLWPDEVEERIVKYPLRFEFSLDYLLPLDEWKEKGINITNFIQMNMGRGAFADLLRGGVNFIRDKNLVAYLYEEFKEKLNFEIKSSKNIVPIKTVDLPLEETGLHSHLIYLIVEIGRMNKFLSEKEYTSGNMRFDAIWRRIDRGSPTYVFEVQVGGDVYRALAKLKHAFDLWNSNIFLVCSNKKDFYSAKELLNGTFHEIKGKIRTVRANEMIELHKRKLSWIELEQKLGIL